MAFVDIKSAVALSEVSTIIRLRKAASPATDTDDPVKPWPLFERDAEVEQKRPPPQCQQQRNKETFEPWCPPLFILLTLDQSNGMGLCNDATTDYRIR